jgi:integrase
MTNSKIPLNTQKPKLLDQVRTLLRTRHYSLATEKSYIGWIRRFILHFKKRHPRDLGPGAIGKFLSFLAIQEGVSPSTQNQALNALVFLYREVLGINLSEIPGIEWAKKRERIPIVFSKDEVTQILSCLTRSQKLIASLLYGSGLRLAETLRLRVKDIDFERRQIAVWDSKSPKDRLVMLPEPLIEPLKSHLAKTRELHEQDGLANVTGVLLLSTGNNFGPQRTLRTQSGLGIDDSDDPVFEVDGIEVEQESERDIAELQVG